MCRKGGVFIFLLFCCLLARVECRRRHHPRDVNCSLLLSCAEARGTDCGWCWDSDYTIGQVHGGRPGNAYGPTDGRGDCGDWLGSYNLDFCDAHVDCLALPDCLNIAGTYCSWCLDSLDGPSGFGIKSNASCTNSSLVINDHNLCPLELGPRNLHLSFTHDPTIMTLTWVTNNATNSTLVYWPLGMPEANRTLEAITYPFATESQTLGVQSVHVANMTSLQSGQVYLYYVNAFGISSPVYNFTGQRTDTNRTANIVIYGDMGRYGGGFALRAITQKVETETVDFVIHVGDFAYDLDADGGRNGDAFMQRIQPIAANVAYMTCVGNHEDWQNMEQYRLRFNMPGIPITAPNRTVWYSYDYHLVHFIAYSTEVYFSFPQDIDTQFAFLEADLQAANANRAERPWIIAYGHRPMYCSNADGDDCSLPNSKVRSALEGLFNKYGVDIIFEGHEHSYERTYPVLNSTVTQLNYTDPQAPVHIITGFAGCNENDGACFNPIDGPAGPWSAFRTGLQGYYSYGQLYVYNSTTVLWENYLVESGQLEDSALIIQNNHGMRG